MTSGAGGRSAGTGIARVTRAVGKTRRDGAFHLGILRDFRGERPRSKERGYWRRVASWAGLRGVDPGGENGREFGALAGIGADANVGGANVGDGLGRFGVDARHLEVDGVGIRGEAGRLYSDGDFVATEKRAEVFGGAFGDGDDEGVLRKEIADVNAGGGERFFVRLVADREIVGEKDDASRVGVGEVDRALVNEGHGRAGE